MGIQIEIASHIRGPMSHHIISYTDFGAAVGVFRYSFFNKLHKSHRQLCYSIILSYIRMLTLRAIDDPVR